jgi:hypothetical protein
MIMAISTKRFEFLDKETNVAISDFLKGDNLAILNSPNNLKKEITDFLSGFLKNNSQTKGLTGLLDGFNPEDLLSKLPIRLSKDSFPDLKDLTNLENFDVENLASNLISSSSALSSFNSLPGFCINKALNKSPFGKPYNPSVNCNGKNRSTKSASCSNPDFGLSLSDITNGRFDSIYSNLNNALAALIGLSSLGFDMNMCNVFSSLSGNVSNNGVLSRASSALLNKVSVDGNTFGVMDLANSSAGLYTKLEAPSGVSNSLKYFTIPDDTKENDYPELLDRYNGAMEIFDANWNKSDHDGILSSKSFSNNSSLNKLYKSKTKSTIFNTSTLNNAPNNDLDFLGLAASF